MIVLKIILYVLLAVLGLILLILIMPISAKVSYIGGKLEYRVKYAFLGVIDSDGGGLAGRFMKKKADGSETLDEAADSSEEEGGMDKKSAEKKKKKSDKKNNSESESDEITDSAEGDDEPKKTLGEKVGFIMNIWRSAKRPLKKLLKGFHIKDIYIDFLVADEDAYKCAMNYGRVCTGVYNALASFAMLFTTKYKTVDIESGFGIEKSRWDAGCKVVFLPITAVITGAWFLLTYIFRVYLPEKRKNKKECKSAQAQTAQP